VTTEAASATAALQVLASCAFGSMILDDTSILNETLKEAHEHVLRSMVRYAPALRNIPVIVISSDMDAQKGAMEATGMRSLTWQAQPYQPEELITRLRGLVSGSEPAAGGIEPLDPLTEGQSVGDRMLEIDDSVPSRETISRGDRVADLESQNLELTRLQQQREEYSAVMIHDLKNPLGVILLGVHLLRGEKALSEPGRQVLRRIGHSADSMHRMIMNLMDIGRSEGEGLEARYSRVELPLLLEDVGDMMRPRSEDRRQQFQVEVTGEWKPVSLDRDLVRRILENLLDNAIRFSPPESLVRLSGGRSKDGQVLLSVSDQGPGLSEAQKRFAFEKYARSGAREASERRSERGLGLVFCRMAVEALGGRLWIEPNEPRGSCFYVQFPESPMVGRTLS